MFTFGVLKFVNPFKAWYTVQVTNSGLGQISYAMGITGEIVVGTTLFVCLIYGHRMSKKLLFLLKNASLLTIVIIMLTGLYVHLHPDVPAEVLPLKIKPPYIPVFFLLIALSNIVFNKKQYQGS